MEVLRCDVTEGLLSELAGHVHAANEAKAGLREREAAIAEQVYTCVRASPSPEYNTLNLASRPCILSRVLSREWAGRGRRRW